MGTGGGAQVLTQLCPHCQGSLELAVDTYAPDSWAVECGAHYLHPHAAPMGLFLGLNGFSGTW